jgi:hypothetical protein
MTLNKKPVGIKDNKTVGLKSATNKKANTLKPGQVSTSSAS